MQTSRRRGFSLVELVVVVLLMGIIAAVAAPKMFDTFGDARLSATKQSLAVLRDAVELYKVKNETYPPKAATMETDLKPFLKGSFPAAEVGKNKGKRTVAETDQNPITQAAASADGWIYNPATGELCVNDAAYLDL